MKLSKNFKAEEFKCKCGCGEMRIAPSIVVLCELIRARFKQPVTVVSGARCPKHNANVGGAKTSQHMPKGDGYSHAVDLRVRAVKPKVVYDFVNELFPESLGVGLYDSWVHIDDRIDKAYRWGIE